MPSNLEFFQKISPVFNGKLHLIPPSKLTPLQREQRRLAYRNERNLYRRKSSLSGKEMISFFHQDSVFKVYTHDEWWSQEWDALKYGRPVDLNASFFDQFYQLQLAVPRPPLVNNKAENSPYCNFADENKNCHLLTSANRNEDCYYGFLMVQNKNCVDGLWCTDCELVYQGVDCQKCYNVRYAQDCENCSDSAFLYECKGCSNCLLCTHLRGKSYHVRNRPVSKETYEKIRDEWKGSYAKHEALKAEWLEMKANLSFVKAATTVACEHVSGDHLYHCKNVIFGFDVYQSEDCAWVHDGLNGKDCRDICFFDHTEKCYESTSLMGYGYRFTNFCRDSADLFYCDNCHGCRNLFGCVGLRNKEYCILNRQYSKEEYERVASALIQSMSARGEWGEFFPVKYSLFGYNETLAEDYFPLEEAQAKHYGWKWKSVAQTEIVNQTVALPDNIYDVGENGEIKTKCGEGSTLRSASCLDAILSCEVTEKNFKITKQEFAFYKKMGVPLPHHHPDTRNFERLALRTGRVLREAICDQCKKPILTARPLTTHMKIYCEACWLREVY